jgi:RNA polymerase sigma-70 factor (ECF subfamily)
MEDLVAALKAGRPEAFERLVREFGDRLYRFARRLAGEPWAEDVTQEVLLRIFRSIGGYRPEGRFEAWLFSIANHVAIDFARRRRPERWTPDLEGARQSPSPLEDLEDRERRAALLRAVERLPVEQRQVFLLREEAGLSFKEIAEMLGCPINTALGRMHYAMEHLRKAMKAHGMR